MRARFRSSDSILIAAALVAVGFSLAFLHVPHTKTFFAFALLVAASEMFEVSLPDGTPYSLGLAPALGFALLHENHSPAQTLVAFAVGIGAAMVIRLTARENPRAAEGAIHLLALGAATLAYRAVRTAPGFGVFDVPARSGGSHFTLSNSFALLGIALTLLTIIMIVESFAQAIRVARTGRARMTPILIDFARALLPLHLATLSVGALLALSFPSLGLWAFPLFLAPLAATQYAFRQFASIKSTYLQTIRALSRVPEMAGYTADGHSTRVADLSVAVAREMGINEQEVSEIEYAALLHDIGRVSLSDPDSEDISTPELATIGAGIVRETGHFPRVADMIENQQQEYRHRGEQSSDAVPVGARIIKVASAYDDFTNPGGIGHTASDALERLYVGMAYDFDPVVIQALTRVLERREDAA